MGSRWKTPLPPSSVTQVLLSNVNNTLFLLKACKDGDFYPFGQGVLPWGAWTELHLCLDCEFYPNNILKFFTQEQSLPFLMHSLFQSLDWISCVQKSSYASALVKKELETNHAYPSSAVSAIGQTCKMIGACTLQICPCYSGFPCCSEHLNI